MHNSTGNGLSRLVLERWIVQEDLLIRIGQVCGLNQDGRDLGITNNYVVVLTDTVVFPAQCPYEAVILYWPVDPFTGLSNCHRVAFINIVVDLGPICTRVGGTVRVNADESCSL